MYELMEYLGYDAVTLGNHEFNFGLDFLKNAMSASKGEIKFVNSNVLDAVTKKPIVSDYNEDGKDYQIIERQVKDQNGQMKTVKVGVFGVVTPQIMAWDAGNLTGKSHGRRYHSDGQSNGEEIKRRRCRRRRRTRTYGNRGYDGSKRRRRERRLCADENRRHRCLDDRSPARKVPGNRLSI